jgi:PPOX class probable F420-dependent enzyme
VDRTLEHLRSLDALDHGLAVVSTRRPDGTIQASVVNAGVVDHPIGGDPVLAFVARGGTAKLRHLRRDPAVTLTVRVGWDWLTVEGRAQLLGPDDLVPGVDVPQLLRDVFHAAGGQHDDLDEYDRVMHAERRTAVLVPPARLYGNEPSHEHVG